MKKYSLAQEAMLVNFGAFLIIIITSMAIDAYAFPYAINFWLLYFGKHAAITWWHGVLIGFVPWIGQFAIAFAVITWILSLFLN